jgi:hypothetical protein
MDSICCLEAQHDEDTVLTVEDAWVRLLPYILYICDGRQNFIYGNKDLKLNLLLN